LRQATKESMPVVNDHKNRTGKESRHPEKQTPRKAATKRGGV